MKRFVWAIVAVGGCATGADSIRTGSSESTSFEERLLATLPAGMDIRDAVVSANGRAIAYPLKTSAGTVVLINGTPSESYERVWDLQISGEGKTVAFLAKKDGHCFVVVNGRKGERFPSIQSLRLSPDGSAVMYTAWIGRRAYQTVVQDRKGELFEEVSESGGTFSPDGKRVAFQAGRGEKSFIVVDGNKGEEFSFVGRPVFSPDGSRVAFSAENKKLKYVVLDGTKIGPFDFVFEPDFTPEGKIFYVANRGGEFAETFAGVPTEPPRGGKWILGIGEEQREMRIETLSWPPRLTPDGRVFYVASKGGQQCLVLGDQAGPLFRSVRAIGISPDGKSMAYVARLSDDPNTPGDHLVIDGKAGQESFPYIESYAWSPDGKVIALKIHAPSGIQVVVGRRRSEGYQLVYDFNFSPDGKKLAFCARRGREIWWKVMELN